MHINLIVELQARHYSNTVSRFRSFSDLSSGLVLQAAAVAAAAVPGVERTGRIGIASSHKGR